MDDPAVLILQGNSPEIQDSIILKLLKLYNKHEILSNKIIVVLNFISKSIESGNGEKIEIYSKIEKTYITKLENINLIIKSFEAICSIKSDKLDRSRALLLSGHETIQIMNKIISENLKTSLDALSVTINNFSLKYFHAYPPVSKLTPQFVDLSI